VHRNLTGRVDRLGKRLGRLPCRECQGVEVRQRVVVDDQTSDAEPPSVPVETEPARCSTCGRELERVIVVHLVEVPWEGWRDLGRVEA